MLTTVLLTLAAAEADPTPPPIGVTPWPTRRDATEMHFIAYQGDEEYTVKAGAQSCTTPCTLTLKPGPTKLKTEGSGEIEVQLVVPHLAAQVRLSHGAPRWLTPTGATLLPLGVVMAVSLWALGLTCSGFGSSGCTIAHIVTWPIIGTTTAILGVVFLAMGARSPPLDANRAEILDARNGVSLSRLALAVLQGGFSF